MKITKNNYLLGFAAIVLILTLLRLISPDVAAGIKRSNISVDKTVADRTEKEEMKRQDLKDSGTKKNLSETNSQESASAKNLSHITAASGDEAKMSGSGGEMSPLNACPVFLTSAEKVVKNGIMSVSNYSVAFPDSNHVQMVAAKKYGVPPVADREEAESRKREFVCMNLSPFYRVDRMRQSIPYLVPRASVLLNDIGRAFYDSLQNKGVPIHQLIVTSVLRTKDDVKRLRNYNSNATENSCHMFGTTFDISYNRFAIVHNPGENRRSVGNDTLKWVLSEVLNDLRLKERCYIKYERKQGCFHITTR